MEHESIDAPATTTSTTTSTTSSATTFASTDVRVAEPAATLVDDELLVEEISIDGMCGVY
jgi:mycofactocin precursor